SRRVRAPPARERSRRTPTESRPACPANRVRGGARRSTSRGAAPTPRACVNASRFCCARFSVRVHFQGSIRSSAAASVFGAEIAAQNRRVGVDAAVAEKRPVSTDRLDERRVALRNDDLLLFSGLHDIAAEWIRHEGVSEERDAIGAWLV